MEQVFDVSMSQLRSWCNSLSDGMRPNNRFMTDFASLNKREHFFYGCYVVVEMATGTNPDYYNFGFVWCTHGLDDARLLVATWEEMDGVLHPSFPTHYEIWHVLDDLAYAEKYDFGQLFDLENMTIAIGYPQPSQYFGTIDDVVVYVATALADYAVEYNCYAIAYTISEYDKRSQMYRLLPEFDDKRHDYSDSAFWSVVAANAVENEFISF